jgi:SAM-dependent methyltransferase
MVNAGLNHPYALGLLILLMSTFLLKQPFRNLSRKIKLWEWQRALKLAQHAACFNQMYLKVNGFFISLEARKKFGDAPQYVYGEIEFLPFIALLSLTKPNEHTVFYDLGCGTGKAILACAMVYPIKRAVGIELFPSLYQAACAQKNLLGSITEYTPNAAKIEFILGDYFEVAYTDATTIFINSTSLFGATWERLCALIDALPQVTTVITTSKPLTSNRLNAIATSKLEMSWGVVTAFIHSSKQLSTNPIEIIE